MQHIPLKLLDHGKDLPLPKRQTPLSSGFDLLAAIEEEIVLAPMERILIPTGFSMEMTKGLEAQIRPRSGLAYKHGLTVLNTPGTIDADYRGEVKVLLINLGSEPFIIKRGERVAQMVIAPVAADIDLVETTETTETLRGAGGFGSTGK